MREFYAVELQRPVVDNFRIIYTGRKNKVVAHELAPSKFQNTYIDMDVLAEQNGLVNRSLSLTRLTAERGHRLGDYVVANVFIGLGLLKI